MNKTHIFFAIICAFLFTRIDAFKVQQRIVNGFSSESAKYPFYALLVLSKIGEKESFKMCGGSIISNEWILTAAHCVYNVKRAIACLGLTQMNQVTRKTPTMIIERRDIYAHENYKPIGPDGLGLDDIALIQLPDFIRFSEIIQPIALSNVHEIEDYTEVIAIGSGHIDSTQENAKVLQWAPLDTIPMEICSKFYKFVGSSESVFCAVSEQNRSVCVGDSGGPLIRKDDNKLMGVASFARVDDYSANWPQGFTKVSAYFGWISNITGLKLDD